VAPLILSLGTRCRRVAKLTVRPFYHRERTPIPIEHEIRQAPTRVFVFWTKEETRAATGFPKPYRPARKD
jgi:hypothetical protein